MGVIGPMTNELFVTSGELFDASRQMDGKADDIAQGVSALARSVDDLMVGGWEGTAAASFDSAWMDWRIGADEVVQALRDAAENLQWAASEYDAQDAQTASEIAAKGR